MVEVKDIKKVALFSVFSDSQSEALAKITERIAYKEGSLIYQSDEPANHIFVVTSGLVGMKKIVPEEDLEISFEKREKGEIFGTACFMEPQKYTLTAVCLKETEVLAIDADKLRDICNLDPQLGYRFMKEVAKVYFERYKVAKRQIHAMVADPTVITALPG
ncbi:MAG: cyclic nucleotide-binding domain-containing protein [Desulfobacterales bacterium]|uniref:Cyclic nucleotide-binding domain-containing protein n=1 Tax=Candidatus Desulfatibia vada TaxID=2841696 RepID=A0A8J6TRH1_9BACT|nr:cyclic nucleotide-binding domain-containing protein [Candidatus Desulfatibia vada]MBL6970904.1 cyclic nucleotide-binding domain-containing protein [Desulfobacterales bacterium]